MVTPDTGEALAADANHLRSAANIVLLLHVLLLLILLVLLRIELFSS